MSAVNPGILLSLSASTYHPHTILTGGDQWNRLLNWEGVIIVVCKAYYAKIANRLLKRANNILGFWLNCQPAYTSCKTDDSGVNSVNLVLTKQDSMNQHRMHEQVS